MATLITNSDLGNSLLILGDKLEVKEPLKGNNYIVVYGNLLNTFSNGKELVDKLAFAKTLTPNGQLLSDTNRMTVLVAPGKYDVDFTLEMDTPYVDLISLTGDADVFLTSLNGAGDTAIKVTTSDIKIKGFNLTEQGNNIIIEGAYSNNYFENIIGSGGSFSNGTFGGQVAGNFKNCVGGEGCFANIKNEEILISSTLENCTAVEVSFGYVIVESTLINCLAGAQSFGFFAISESILNDCESGMESFGCAKAISGSTLTNCTADRGSFGRTNVPGESTIIEASQLNNCKAGNNSFAVKNSDDSSFINCVGGDESFGANIANSIYKNCKGGNNSFGAGLQSWPDLIAGGKFYNCEAGDGSFGTNESTGNFYYCKAGDGSFGTNESTGNFYYCKAGDGSFLGNTFGKFTGNAYFTTGMNPSYLGASILAYCLDWNNNPINNLNTTTNNI
jgi:hypothetical protein